MTKEKRFPTRYQVKTVIFDIQAECRQLKRLLSDAGITVIVPFFGLRAEYILKELFPENSPAFLECLFLTNNQQHAKIASGLGMAVAGCMEGHFEVPKAVTLLEAPEEISVNYLNLIFCHEKKIPAVVAETKRFYIAEMTAEDMDVLYEILTDKETAKYLPAKVGTKEEELEKLVSYVSHVYSFFEYGYWGVFDKQTGELVGRAGFKEGSYPLEAGYVIKRTHWGKGIATEVVKELVRYAGEELACNEIIANIDERNSASLRVAEKCGIVCNRLRIIS